MVGYNEKYPSGLRNVTLSPPLSITLTFEIFAGRPNPVELNPGGTNIKHRKAKLVQ